MKITHKKGLEALIECSGVPSTFDPSASKTALRTRKSSSIPVRSDAPLDMGFFRLSAEIRVMIYKELCPSTLHYPYSATQKGMEFLAVSHQTRLEFLPVIRTTPSIILHLKDRIIYERFLEWIKQSIDHVPLPLTELIIEIWLDYQEQSGAIAHCKMQYTLAIDKSTCRVMFTRDEPSPGQQIWVSPEPLLKPAALNFSLIHRHALFALRKLVKGLSRREVEALRLRGN